MSTFKKYHDTIKKETEKFINDNMVACSKNYQKHIMAKEMLATLYYLEHIDMETSEEFNETMAKHWVAKMNPKAKWSIEETTKVAEQYGVKFEHISNYCWWVAMNKIYSDYGKTISKYSMADVGIYVDMAKDWLFDEDSAVTPREKMLIEYKYLMKRT